VKTPSDWSSAKTVSSRSLQTREVISWINEAFGEAISPGSYDDIRRKDLYHLRLAEFVVTDDPTAARNSPRRGWGVNDEASGLLRSFDKKDYERELQKYLGGRQLLSVRLAAQRDLAKHEVQINGELLDFGPGEHNQLIKCVIEDFLPRFGFDAEVLYVGDASARRLILMQQRLVDLGFFEVGNGELLPDVIAYSVKRNWIFLIEAVHSSGPVSQERRFELSSLLTECESPVVYITAFADREKFRQWAADVGWETEVWIASHPDHMIHFNGDKFLGPYQVNDS
jgi:type II restriction enzyme